MLLGNFVLQAGRPLWEPGEVWCHLDVRIGGNGCVAGVRGQNKRGLHPPGNLPLRTYALGSQPPCCKEAQATRSGSRHPHLPPNTHGQGVLQTLGAVP